MNIKEIKSAFSSQKKDYRYDNLNQRLVMTDQQGYPEEQINPLLNQLVNLHKSINQVFRFTKVQLKVVIRWATHKFRSMSHKAALSPDIA
jgi:hypothetical protein